MPRIGALIASRLALLKQAISILTAAHADIETNGLGDPGRSLRQLNVLESGYG